jgi:hypothetical protein
MKLIRELVEDIEIERLDEEAGKKALYIKGPFLRMDIGNQNGRTYPKHIMEREVHNYTENYIKKNRAVGELGHPPTPNINLDRVSHMIEELTPVNNTTYYGKAKILESTPMGKIASNLINEGVQLGVSSRGVGSVKLNKQGLKEIQEDFKLKTPADIVADPSAPDCFVQGIYEEAEWIFEGGVWKESKLMQARNEIINASSAELEATKIRIFEEFVNNIKV